MTWIRPCLIAAVLTAAAAGPAPAGPIYTDPVGDTFPGNPTGPDVVGISADTFVNPGFATFSAQFAGAIAPPSAFAPNSLTGIIDIDIDRNPATGNTSPLVNLFAGAPPFNLGSEFSIDLFSELFHPGFVDITDGSGLTTLATVPITFTADGFTFMVPNSVFGQSGNYQFNFAGVFGDFLAPSDRVPNGPTPLLSTPEPANLAAFGLVGIAAGVYARRRVTRAPS
jgi:hypothetical protein